MLYGSGYVLLAFLREGLVVDRDWMTERQLLDAIAIFFRVGSVWLVVAGGVAGLLLYGVG